MNEASCDDDDDDDNDDEMMIRMVMVMGLQSSCAKKPETFAQLL